MLVLITYDVNTETPEGRKRLRRVAKICTNMGQRVQKSVFECLLDPSQLTLVRQQLMSIIDYETDSIRFYYLGKNWHPRVDHIGLVTSYDPEGPLVI